MTTADIGAISVGNVVTVLTGEATSEPVLVYFEAVITFKVVDGSNVACFCLVVAKPCLEGCNLGPEMVTTNTVNKDN